MGARPSVPPFLAFWPHDGRTDLFMVLDDRIRLDDALRAKRRHANDTGSCHHPVGRFPVGGLGHPGLDLKALGVGRCVSRHAGAARL